MMDNNRREKIRQMIHVVLGKGEDVIHIADDDRLVSTGLLNSLQIVNLANMLEKTYGVDFSTLGFNVYYFETIISIEELMTGSM